MTQLKPEYIKHYINYNNMGVSIMRQFIIFFLFVFCDLFIVLSAFSDPFEPWYVYTVVPPILLLHFFALWILISPYKRQVQAFLYVGIYSIIASLGFLIITHKMMYSMMRLTSPVYMILIVIIYLLIVYFFLRWHLKRIATGFYYYSNGRSKQVKPVGNSIYLVYAGLGVFIGQLALGFTNGQIMYSVFASATFALAIVTGCQSLYLHKYILIRRHPEWYEWEQKQK